MNEKEFQVAIYLIFALRASSFMGAANACCYSVQPENNHLAMNVHAIEKEMRFALPQSPGKWFALIARLRVKEIEKSLCDSATNQNDENIIIITQVSFIVLQLHILLIYAGYYFVEKIIGVVHGKDSKLNFDVFANKPAFHTPHHIKISFRRLVHFVDVLKLLYALHR